MSGKEPLRVALVDEDAPLHLALRNHFTRPGMGWHLDSYTDAADALKGILATPPQVVLMEREVRGQCGIECTRKLKARLPDLPVVLFTAQLEAGTLVSALLAGACGCLLKPMTPTCLVPHLDKALAGGMPLCARAERLLRVGFCGLGRSGLDLGLSQREQELMLCLCRHRSDKAAARELGISGTTVNTHLKHIFRKLAVHDRESAIGKFLRGTQE